MLLFYIICIVLVVLCLQLLCAVLEAVATTCSTCVHMCTRGHLLIFRVEIFEIHA